MKAVLTLIFIFASTLALHAQTTIAKIESPTASTASVRLEAFNMVWNTVNEKHYDPTFGGVNWVKVGETYKPKALAAKSDIEFHAILRQMLGELKLSHFGVHPKSAGAQAVRQNGVLGIDIKIVAGRPVISRVEFGSPADKAGVRPGFIVSKIGGKTISDLLRPLEQTIATQNLTFGMKMIYRERMLEALTSGPAGTFAELELLDAANTPKKFRVERQPFTGEMSEPLGNFPAQPVEFESRFLPGNIGYMRFTMWVIPQMPKIRSAVRRFANAKGIIIDLRGNPGGIGGMASGVAGLFSTEQTSLGSMRSRGGVTNFVVYPQQTPFAGPVAILVDHGSGSTSEVFAAGMQEIGAAVVIGETTAGAVLPSVMEPLPTGWLFQYAISDYRTPGNILIEGRGVAPDIEVELTRKGLLEGRDPQLEAAVKYIYN